MDIIDRARKYVAKMDPAVSGAGGHNATFAVAVALVQGFNLSESDAWALLNEYSMRCTPPWNDKDLRHKLKQAESATTKQERGWLVGKNAERGKSSQEEGVVRRAPVKEKWIPAYDEAKLRAVVRGMPAVDESWFIERSPIDPRGITSGSFIEHAFLPGDCVLVFTDFRSQGDYLWQCGKGGWRLAETRGVAAVRSKLPTDGGADGVWFLSNPVDGKWHLNQREGGRYSRRSAEAVTSWRHLVIESDCADSPTWLRFLGVAPLAIAAIYSSGGRSWHALLRVDQPDKASFDTLLRQHAKRTLPLLGADPGALTAVRLTRLPGCTRGGRMQQLIYLNPGASYEAPKPIRDFPKLRTL